MILSKGEMSITLNFCRTVVSWKQAFVYCTLSISFSNPISAFRETVKEGGIFEKSLQFSFGNIFDFSLPVYCAISASDTWSPHSQWGCGGEYIKLCKRCLWTLFILVSPSIQNSIFWDHIVPNHSLVSLCRNYCFAQNSCF